MENCTYKKTCPSPRRKGRSGERRRWYHQESNRGHTDFQSVALPTELWHRFFFYQEVRNSFEYRCFLIAGAKVRQFSDSCKFFCNFFQKKRIFCCFGKIFLWFQLLFQCFSRLHHFTTEIRKKEKNTLHDILSMPKKMFFVTTVKNLLGATLFCVIAIHGFYM